MNRKIRMLCVEDDPNLGSFLKKELSSYGNAALAQTLPKAMDHLSQDHFDLAIIDLNLDYKGAGLSILKEAAKRGIYSVILSGNGGEESIFKAYELGCQDYFIKGDETNTLHEIVGRYFIKSETRNLQEFFKNDFITLDTDLISGIKSLFSHKENLIPLFLQGPKGTGKTHLAKKIPDLLAVKGPFFQIDFSQMNPSDMLNEVEDLLKNAENGTIFLDHIEKMPLSVQDFLLKEFEIRNIFSPEGHLNKFFLITSSSENLFSLINKGLFNKRLFFRLTGIDLFLRPLRERKADIIPLLKHLAQSIHGETKIPSEVVIWAQNYEWPSNITEMVEF